MINIISKKKNTNKKPKQNYLQKLFEEFEILGFGLIQDIFENFGRNYELSKEALQLMMEEKLN